MYAMPQCSPTRSAAMTGRFAFNIGMQHFTTLIPGGAAGIPKDTPTIAEVLRGAGYETHMIGKWVSYTCSSHVPSNSPCHFFLAAFGLRITFADPNGAWVFIVCRVSSGTNRVLQQDHSIMWPSGLPL
jgi:arylsulfatase A-like enzyme